MNWEARGAFSPNKVAVLGKTESKVRGSKEWERTCRGLAQGLTLRRQPVGTLPGNKEKRHRAKELA